MSLTQALNVARSGLTVTALQTDLVSRNIANSTTEGFARKSADLVTSKYGSVSASSVDRSVSTMLQRLDRENESKLTLSSIWFKMYEYVQNVSICFNVSQYVEYIYIYI